MFSQVLLITVIVIATSTKSIDGASLEEPKTERIVGGIHASRGQFPWTVALFYNDGFICTGSIMSKQSILTSANCVVFNEEVQSAEDYHAIANVSKSAGSVRIDFASVTPHPDYNGESTDNDVAVFKTTAEIPFGDEVEQICLARPDTPMMEYKKATVMGWGNTSPFRSINVIPDDLQYIEQEIIDNSMCSRVNAVVNDDMICANGNFTGVCNGDSGGPLVAISQDMKPVQIGITSYTNGNVGCGKSVPSVYTRVSAQYDFIMQAANDDSICTV